MAPTRCSRASPTCTSSPYFVPGLPHIAHRVETSPDFVPGLPHVVAHSRRYMKTMCADFGCHEHWYEADGYFAAGRPPWCAPPRATGARHRRIRRYPHRSIGGVRVRNVRSRLFCMYEYESANTGRLLRTTYQYHVAGEGGASLRRAPSPGPSHESRIRIGQKSGYAKSLETARTVPAPSATKHRHRVLICKLAPMPTWRLSHYGPPPDPPPQVRRAVADE